MGHVQYLIRFVKLILLRFTYLTIHVNLTLAYMTSKHGLLSPLAAKFHSASLLFALHHASFEQFKIVVKRYQRRTHSCGKNFFWRRNENDVRQWHGKLSSTSCGETVPSSSPKIATLPAGPLSIMMLYVYLE